MEVSPSHDAGGRIPVIIAGLDGISGVSAWSFRLRDALLHHPTYRVVLVNCRVTGNHVGQYDYTAPSQTAMRRLLQDLAPAIVLPNFVWPVFDVCAALIAEGVPLWCVGFCRADSAVEYYNPLTWYEPLVSGFAAVSPECGQRLASLLEHRKDDIALMPTGVTVPPDLDRAYQTAPLRVVYGGRIVQPQKRVLDFVPLVEALLARSCDFVFDIVGQGRQLGELKSAMADLDHGGRVRFVGKVPPAEMDAVWRGHDVFVQASDFEGTSNSMLESMAQGAVPVITRTESGVAGIIEHGTNGFLVPVGDMEAMADALCALAADGARLEATGRAAGRAARRFSMEFYAERFTALLDQTMQMPVRAWPASRTRETRPVIEGLDLPEEEAAATAFSPPAKARRAVPPEATPDEIPPEFDTPATLVLAAAADENFVMPLAAMVKSVLCNLALERRAVLYVIDGGIRDASKTMLLESWDSKLLLVRWLLPDMSALGDLKISGHVNALTYCRLLIPYLLPERHAKAIYLDSDFIVLDDIGGLWDMDMGNSHVLAAQDMTAPYMCSETALPNFPACAPYLSAARALENFRALGIPPQNKYFNAGLMVLNVAKWRATGASHSIIAYLRDNAAHVRWWDQDGINAVLFDRWRELDPRWNQIPHIFRHPTWRESPFSEAVYDAVTKHPKALHFSARSKPWHGDNDHPFRDEFFRYLDRTAWAGWRPEMPLELVTNGAFETWENGAPSGWNLLPGSVVEPSTESRRHGTSARIHPHEEKTSAGFEQLLLTPPELAGARLSLSMACRCGERHALALNLHVTAGGRKRTYSAEHPGHGAWATLRHEIDLPRGAAPARIQCLVVLRAAAGAPAIVENVRGLAFLPQPGEGGLEWDVPKPVDFRGTVRRAAWRQWLPVAWFRSAARMRRRRALRAMAKPDGTGSDRSTMFSVILSNYNGAEFLEEALLGVARQEYTPFEFIIVDDGSTDDSPAIIRELARQYPTLIKTLFKDKNEGQAAGFNDGFRMACGDNICFIDSDDRWFPDKLARLAALVQANPGCAIYQHNLYKMLDNEVSREKFRDVVQTGDLLAYTQRTRYFPYFVPTSGLAFSRHALENVMPIPVEFRVCADGFLTRTALCFGPIASSNECWGAYRVHAGNNVYENPDHDVFAYANGLLIPALNAFYRANGIDLSFEVKPVRKSPDGAGPGLAPRAKATNRPLLARILDSSIRELLREARRRLPLP